MKALTQLLALERPTSKAMAYTDWPTPPQVNIEIEEAIQYYQVSPNINTL
jgi:hypothetical protein